MSTRGPGDLTREKIQTVFSHKLTRGREDSRLVTKTRASEPYSYRSAPPTAHLGISDDQNVMDVILVYLKHFMPFPDVSKCEMFGETRSGPHEVSDSVLHGMLRVY